VSGMVDPGADRGADPRLRFDDPMRCECGGTGTVTDAGEVGGGWWLVAWWTEHRPGCGGLEAPERAYLVASEAFARGDYRLPGLEADEVRLRRLPAPLPAWPPARCTAYAYTTGQRCRLPAGPDGLCGVHRRRR
jgi:hypothetical protein